MIKVNVVHMGMHGQRFDFQCPKCRHIMRFFMACPSHCTNCESEVPNAVALVRHGDDRRMYHRKGKTPAGSRMV